MELATQIFQFILSISILVILHELGHFLPAKWFKCRVDKFYLFFDPWFSLAKKKIGETEYGIGWLPFGGYVKIAGMVDESMDTEQLKQPAQPWEFRSKPAWQRLIIMLGGIFVNVVLAILIYTSLNYFHGEDIYATERINQIAVSEAGRKIGFENGDKILKIDGKKTQKDFNKQILDILFSENITVLRNGKEVNFKTNEDGIADVFKDESPKTFLLPRTIPIVDDIIFKETEKAGLKKGDKILSINGKKIDFYDQVKVIAQQNKGRNISAEVLRNNSIVNLTLPINKNGFLGFHNLVYTQKVIEDLKENVKYPSITSALVRGYERSKESLTYQIKQFKLVFNKKVQGYKKVSGPIGIVKMMPEQIDWVKFWEFTAMFSIWLAFLNLLPIPGLDGGHALFTTWELITGKPVPQKVLENAQMIGVIFLMGLMLLIFGSDIYKFIISPFLK